MGFICAVLLHDAIVVLKVPILEDSDFNVYRIIIKIIIFVIIIITCTCTCIRLSNDNYWDTILIHAKVHVP